MNLEWLDKMSDALDYIEQNLTEQIDLSVAASKAGTSAFNFQRFFTFITDVSVSEYIRKRRLSLAAMELISTDHKVIDVAIKYGYESPVSFSRAFFAVQGILPSEVRYSTKPLKSYPPISFEITIKGVTAMNYRVEEIKEVRLVGYKERFTMDNGENFIRIPEFWNSVSSSDKINKLMSINDNKHLGCLGVCADGDEKSFDYYIATGSSKPLINGMSEITIPASTYIIFECRGQMPDAQQLVWKKIFTEFFPTSAYEYTDGPQIEWYSDGDNTSDDYLSEIWIPVKKK